MTEDVTIYIDGREIKAKAGQSLLRAALDNGVYIPNLCDLRERETPEASCRLCFVELEGVPEPVTSCSTVVEEGMVARTDSWRVRELVAAGFELLMTTHPVDCAACPGNKRCALQEIAKKMKFKLKSGRLPEILRDAPLDLSHPRIGYDSDRCVMCGRCVHVCDVEAGARAIDFIHRGLKMTVGVFGGGSLAESSCISCMRCVEVCPVKAFYEKTKETDV